MHRLLLVLAALMLATQAWAQSDTSRSYMTGTDLFDRCSNPEDVGCQGYVLAIADALTSGAVNGDRACIPLQVTPREAVDVVRTYLTDAPEDRHYIAAGVVARALSKAWPCPK
jgi:hypothetical protein